MTLRAGLCYYYYSTTYAYGYKKYKNQKFADETSRFPLGNSVCAVRIRRLGAEKRAAFTRDDARCCASAARGYHEDEDERDGRDRYSAFQRQLLCIPSLMTRRAQA